MRLVFCSNCCFLANIMCNTKLSIFRDSNLLTFDCIFLTRSPCCLGDEKKVAYAQFLVYIQKKNYRNDGCRQEWKTKKVLLNLIDL